MIRPPPRSTLFPTRRSSDLVFGGPNPYSTIAVSDRFGAHANVPDDLLIGADEFRELTIEKAYWWSSPERKDRKSTRLNSSHVEISYAVFCLKKKKKRIQELP